MNKSISHILRKIVHIHKDEARPFLFLSTHAFFNGLGVALAFAAINIIVIKKQSIEILPWLYVASSVLLIVGGVLYTKLEHAFPPKKVFIFSLIFCVIWAFTMRFLLSPDNSLFFIGLAYSSYYLILVLTNLDLWGSAALVFNVRQSKRLFGPLSFSESIGGIIGYSMSAVIIQYMAVQDMMILSGLSFLVSAIVLYNMRNRYLQADHNVDHGGHDTSHHSKGGFWSRLFHDNEYIKKLSILILLSTLVYYLITYGFLSRVEVQFKSLTDIAWFIGMFLSGVKIMNLVIKFILSSHVFRTLGVQFGLILLPVIIIIISGAGLMFFTAGTENPLFYIYLFSALYFFDKLFRSSLSKPSYLIMFQPMSPSMRLSGHTITKGYFEPLGMGVAGGMILLLSYLKWFSLETLLTVILFISIMWLLACRLGVKQYLVELQAALKNRLFGNNIYQLSQKEIELVTNMKLESKNELDRLYALSLLQGKIPKTKEAEVYGGLLASENNSIVKTALLAIENRKVNVSQITLSNLLNHAEVDIRKRAAYALAAIYGEKSLDVLVAAIEADPNKSNSFIGALIKYTGIHGTLAGGGRLLKLSESKSVSDRILAANIIEETDSKEYNTILLEFIKDKDDDVKIAGINGAKDTADGPLMKEIFKLLGNRKFLPAIKQCVESNQEVAFLELTAAFSSGSALLKKRMIEVAGKMNAQDSTPFLLNQLTNQQYDFQSTVIGSLYDQAFIPENHEQKKIIHQVIKSKLTELQQLVKIYKGLGNNMMLKEGLKSELESIGIINILSLLSFIYNKKTVDKIMRHILSGGEKADVANAIELLENLLPNKWSRKFVAIIESVYDHEKSGREENDSQVIFMMNLIEKEKIHISDYLFGLLIRTVDNLGIPINQHVVQIARSKKSPIIAEELLRQSR